MSGVACQVVLVGITRLRESSFEERQSARGIAVRAQLPSTLEAYAHLHDRTRNAKPFGVLKQALAGVEVAAQSCDSGELGEHLGPAHIA